MNLSTRPSRGTEGKQAKPKKRYGSEGYTHLRKLFDKFRFCGYPAFEGHDVNRFRWHLSMTVGKHVQCT